MLATIHTLSPYKEMDLGHLGHLYPCSLTTWILILKTFGEWGIHSNHTPGITFQIKLKTGICRSVNSEKWTGGPLGLLLPNDGLNNATRSPLTQGCRAEALLLRKSKAVQHIIKPASHPSTGSCVGRPYWWNRTGKCAKQLEWDRKKQWREYGRVHSNKLVPVVLLL